MFNGSNGFGASASHIQQTLNAFVKQGQAALKRKLTPQELSMASQAVNTVYAHVEKVNAQAGRVLTPEQEDSLAREALRKAAAKNGLVF